jgi:hypothetical protein
MLAADFGAAYTQIEFFGDEQKLGFADVWNAEYLKQDNYIDAMALISKQAWRQVGGYTHTEGGWEDYDFWCKFVENDISVAFVPEILCRYRVHGSSMLRTETARQNQELSVIMSLRHPWLALHK